MHAAPERRWTQALEEAGCSKPSSRSDSALWLARGALAIDRVAMHVAAGLLLDGTGNIRTVASRVGYRSEAAFSIAFKRWISQRISPDASC